MTLSVYMAKVPTNDATLLEFMRRVNFGRGGLFRFRAHNYQSALALACYQAAPKLQNGND